MVAAAHGFPLLPGTHVQPLDEGGPTELPRCKDGSSKMFWPLFIHCSFSSSRILVASYGLVVDRKITSATIVKVTLLDSHPYMGGEQKKRIGLMCLLSSAACEWFLIVFLFVHASLSHLLSRFAKYCRLEIPCILCSRLDEKNPGCYWNLLCDSHRQEISCLVSCSIHAKFADVHSMCDECLSPIVNHNKSSSDSYRLLVGKSWLDVDRSVLQNLVLNKHVRLGSPDHTCSCCGKTWTAKSGTERLIDLNPEASKLNVKPPLPGRSHFSRRDSLKRLRDKFTRKLTNQPAPPSVDLLSHVGYTELKISSDSESEFPFSDDDNDNRGNKMSLPDVTELSEGGNGNGNVKTSLSVDVGFDVRDSCERTSPCLVSELMSLGDDQRLFHDIDGDSNVLLPHMQALSVLSEFLSLCNIPPSPDGAEIPMKRTSENEGDSPVAENTEASSDDDHSLQTTSMHQTDETGEFSHIRASDPTSSSDSIKFEEDTNNKEPGPPSKEIIPIAHDSKPDKPNTDEDESQDWHTLSDTECDNIVERLIREAEHDKNLLTNLCRELEEERSASAIATNQAMSMITRLQEEKAALHMEALQYLRMMEEQAEYDMEALGRANDILAEKEKEVQDLEIELEFYRNNFLDESSVHNLQSDNGVCEPKNSSSTSFANEKAYITQCLEKLERKIIGRPDGSFTENVIPLSNDDCLREKMNMPGDGFAKEIARLKDRLEALEADRDFVKHTCDALHSGKDGLELVQEIAQQLHELRRMESQKR